RTISPALRRALEVRDRGCRFPGCGLRFTDGHHVEHWADGGETRLDNLILLCGFHHRLVHEGGWRVERWGRGGERRPAFIDPRGGFRMDIELESRRPVELPVEPVEGLVRENRARGVEPDGWSLGPSLPSPPPNSPERSLESPDGPSRRWRPEDARRKIRDRALEALDAAHFGR
ncbi:MAG: HNH endonuclease signature motif containing protein, partial [Gemmatimonadota bacterium]